MNAEGEKTCKNTGNVITYVCRGREAILGASKKKKGDVGDVYHYCAY